MDRYSKAGEEEKEIPLGHLNFLSPQINDMIFFFLGIFLPCLCLFPGLFYDYLYIWSQHFGRHH